MRRARQGADIFDWASAMGRATATLSTAVVSQVSALLGRRASSPASQGRPAPFEAARQVAQRRLNGPAYEVFRLGEQLGRGMIDTAAELATQPAKHFFDPAAALAAGRELANRAFTRRAHRRKADASEPAGEPTNDESRQESDDA